MYSFTYDTKHGQQYTKHGYMKKERLELELNIIKYMYGHMTPIPRY